MQAYQSEGRSLINATSPTEVGTQISTHNTATDAHSSLFNTKQDVLTSANAGQNITITQGSTLPSGFTQLEYIESTGTQYINTNVTNNDNNSIYVDCETTTPQTLYGVSNSG